MMQKVRNQAFPCGHSPLPACRHTISGSLNSPHRGSFHLSLAVLVHYRSTGSIQAYGMVPADSGRIARVPPYLGCPLSQDQISPTRLSRALARLPSLFGYPFSVLPRPRNPGITHVSPVWANFSGFARHYYRNRVFFLFLQVLRCFTSLGSLPLPYGFRQG